MPKITATQAAEKLAERIRNGRTAFANGVNATTKNPMQLAVNNQEKLRTNWLKSVEDGTWARNTLAVTPTQWKQITAGIGAQHYSDSSEKAKTNYLSYANAAYPEIKRIQDEVAAMDDITLQDSEARMLYNMRQMAALRGRFGRGS